MTKAMLDVAQKHRQVMAEQCHLLSVIAENQWELAKIMKSSSGGAPKPAPLLADTPPHAASGPGVGCSLTNVDSMHLTATAGPTTTAVDGSSGVNMY